MEMQDDELLHVCWRDRETKVVGDDFIVFPGDAVFAKVPQSSGRVYSLKFTSSGEVHFYWLQFKNREKDASIEESVNALIDDPDALGGAMQGMGGDMAGAEQLMQLLNANMRQQ
jgi:26S proteasome regulatory subunit N13